ncbi:MAG TPA: M20 family metallopeptidase [Candidatus Limnocylindria bacterium]|nr:M20 family metallopeptidase [Candidatus Limnocylindria bacterium]
MDVTARKALAQSGVDRRAAVLDDLSLRIHGQPELAFEERFASSALADLVEREGVRVRRGVAGLDTAFVAEAGSGRPVVAVLAEYDALPGVGHACGHNLMGTAAAGAFLAARDALDGLGGTVRLVGCPAEERGNGKVRLIEGGVFRDVDAAVMFHPGDRDEIDPLMLALVQLEVEFTGRAAHAAGEPYLGVNALDALMLAWSALSSLRQLVRTDSRIHGIVTDGGQAANIIPERAAARLLVRSPDSAYLEDLRARVLACFQGAATATGCELRYTWSDGMESVVTNRALADAFQANARALGREVPRRTSAETQGSTDLGNVSTRVPAIHPFLAVCDAPVPGHSHAFAKAAATPRALETMRLAAKALAMTALDVLADPGLAQRAKEEHHARR